MHKALLLMLCLGLSACGESLESQRNRATSQVNVLAEKLSAKIGADGYFERVQEVGEVDPWGNPLIVKYERHGVRESLTVRSYGEDGLPLTHDDIAARYHLDSDKARAALRQAIQKSLEEYSSALSRGLTKGVVDVVKESLKK